MKAEAVGMEVEPFMATEDGAMEAAGTAGVCTRIRAMMMTTTLMPSPARLVSGMDINTSVATMRMIRMVINAAENFAENSDQ